MGLFDINISPDDDKAGAFLAADIMGDCNKTSNPILCAFSQLNFIYKLDQNEKLSPRFRDTFFKLEKMVLAATEHIVRELLPRGNLSLEKLDD